MCPRIERIRRYKRDLEKYPHRLIVGSETFCSDAYRFYELAKHEPRLLGDFVWAGMRALSTAKRQAYDVGSEMYPSVKMVHNVGEKRRKQARLNDRPYFMCEYAHAMGVGPWQHRSLLAGNL